MQERSDILPNIVNQQSVQELLARLPGIEKDELGKLVADLHLYIHYLEGKLGNNNPILKEIALGLFPSLNLPAVLIQQEKHLAAQSQVLDGKEKEATPISEINVDERIRLVIRFIDYFANKVGTDPAFEELVLCLKKISNYYEQFCFTYKHASLERQQELLIPKARMTDEAGNFYLIPQALALKFLRLKSDGSNKPRKTFGNHTVVSYHGLHFKSTSEAQGVMLKTAHEIAVAMLYQLLAGEQLIATSSILTKISGVYVGNELKNIERPVQVSYTVPGILFDDVSRLWQGVDHLKRHQPEALARIWQYVLAEEFEKINEEELKELLQPIELEEGHFVRLLKMGNQLFSTLPPEQRLENILTIFDKIDRESLSALYIASLLSNPSDGKTDNYIVAIDDEKGKIVLRIVGIDNDEALEPSVLKYPQNDLHYLNVRCYFYLLPQMSEAIHPEVRERLLQYSPGEMLMKWLAQNYQRECLYKNMLNADIITPEDLFRGRMGKMLDVPLMLRPGTVSEMYRKLKIIQQMLNENSSVTVNELLEASDPLVSYYLRKLKEEEGGDRNHAENWERYVGLKKSSIEAALSEHLTEVVYEVHSDTMVEFKTLQDLLSEARERYDLEDTFNTQTLSEAVQELLSVMDEKEKSEHRLLKLVADDFSPVGHFSLFAELVIGHENKIKQLSKEEQREAIKALIMGKSKVTALNLSGYNQLSNDDVKKIIKFNPNLVKIDLSYCSQLTDEILPILANGCARLEELNLSGLTQLKSLQSKSLLPKPLNFSKLRFLAVDHCPNLQVVNLKAPQLGVFNAEGGSHLTKFEIHKSSRPCRACLEGCDQLAHREKIALLLRFTSEVTPNAIKLLDNKRFYEAVLALVNANTESEEIDLRNCGLKNAHIALLAEALICNNNINKLILDNNKFDTTGANYLLKALEKNNVLTDISLNGCKNLSTDAIWQITAKLEDNKYNKKQRAEQLLQQPQSINLSAARAAAVAMWGERSRSASVNVPEEKLADKKNPKKHPK